METKLEKATTCSAGGRETSLLTERRQHATQLHARGPSPLPRPALGDTLARGHELRYPSHGRELVGWYVAPPDPPAPALLYLHGGWALADRDVHDCQPFIDAGFAVLAPSYRGENGNDGDHEMLWGELDDAHAALDTLRGRSEVDPEHVFVLGHSAGGMLAALLAFEPELGACLTASIDGIYGPEIFDYQRLPFVDSPRERALRLVLPFIEQLEQPHIAFVGREDMALPTTLTAGTRAAASGRPLEVVIVPGDHRDSVAPAVAAFLGCAQRVLAEH